MSEPIEYTTAREQDRAEGFRAGIEAAAQASCIHCAAEMPLVNGFHNLPSGAKTPCEAPAIRALADKPAPDAARKGG